jgi:monofunctional chorismate mutase
MRDISILREDIDNIDKEIVSLLERRLGISKEVAEYKRANNKPILDSTREKEVLAKNVNYVKDEDLKKYIEEMLQCIMDVSKNLQQEVL